VIEDVEKFDGDTIYEASRRGKKAARMVTRETSSKNFAANKRKRFSWN
jgi:hypothetical protein